MQNKHPSSWPDVPNSLCPKLNEDCGPATRLKVLVVVRTVVAAARISGKDTTRETSEPTLPKVVYFILFWEEKFGKCGTGTITIAPTHAVIDTIYLFVWN